MGKKGLDTNEVQRQAHEALYPVWCACASQIEQALREGTEEAEFLTLETTGGALIEKVAGQIIVSAESRRRNKIDETVEITFPLDIRDLSLSEVRRILDVESGEIGRSGGSVPLREFPLYGSLMLEAVLGSEAVASV